MKCALTGHRVLGKDFPRGALEEDLKKLILQGADTFYCGMALGFDLLCCEILVSLKTEWPVRECDEKIVLHEHYEEGCMFERNRRMVDECDVLFAYLRSNRGGTRYTVSYALKKGKKVVYFENKEDKT